MGNYKNKSKTELIKIINSINETKDKFKDISNTEFQSILLSMNEMVFVFNEEQKFTSVNISDNKKLFLDYKKIIGQKYQNVMPECFQQSFDTAWKKNRKGKQSFYEYQLEINNETLHFSVRMSPIFDNDIFKGSVAIILNITKQKKAELELITQNKEYALLNEELIIAKAKAEENEKLFKDILNTVPDPLSVTDTKTKKYIYINKGFEKTTGYTEKDIIGKTVTEINIWKNYTDRELFVKQLKKNGFIQNFESKFKMKNGSIVSGLISANIIYIQGVQNLLIITRDISKIKKTQNKLIISENKFRTIVHFSHAGICLVNENSELTYVNKQFCQITGYNEDELINKSFAFLLDEKSSGKRRYLQKQKGEIVEQNYEISVLCKNKEVKRIEMHSGIIKKADGTIQILSQLLDITERKKAESELEKYREHLEILVKERTEKLESINQKLIDANKDLGEFNQLFINREFRIKELKNRVKELEEKL